MREVKMVEEGEGWPEEARQGDQENSDRWRDRNPQSGQNETAEIRESHSSGEIPLSADLLLSPGCRLSKWSQFS